MNNMKKTQERSKVLRPRLRSSANKSNISFSPRPQATISSYFSSVISENDTEAAEKNSEDLFKSQTQNMLKNNASTTDDDDDFAQKKPLKVAKIFDMKSTKVAKPKKKQRAPKSAPTFGVDVHVSSCSDTNQEHIQLALAMSKSIEEIENPINDTNKQYESPFPSTQDKVNTVRQTLDQFGFKAEKTLNGLPKIKSKPNNIKKKFKYLTPTLFIRTDADRAKMIENNVSAVITNISVYNENNPEFIPEPTNSILDPKKPNSFLLRNYYNPDCIIYKKSGLDLNEMQNNIFYNGTITPSNVKPGSLLRDWSTIAGREITPPRKINPKYTPSEKLQSTPNTNKQTFTHNNVSPCEILSCEILPDVINPIITIESSGNSTPSISNSLNDNCTQFNTNKTNSSQLQINEVKSPQFSTSKNKSFDGNVSPDLFSDEQSDIELNSPTLFTKSPSINNPPEIIKTQKNVGLFTDLNLTQKCINSRSQIQINSDTSESESVSLLDISPRRRKHKLKQNSISEDSDRSLSLLDTVSPRRKHLLKLSRKSDSKARKNIFDVEKSLASKIFNDNIEHVESFCNDINDVFDLTQSSDDSTQFNDAKVISNIEIDEDLNSSKNETISGVCKIDTKLKSPDLNTKTIPNIYKTSEIPENSDADDDYLSVTQLLDVYSTQHTYDVDLTQTSKDSSEKAFTLRLSPELNLDVDCDDSFINDLPLNETAISSSGTESPELSQSKSKYNEIETLLKSPENSNDNEVPNIRKSDNYKSNILNESEICESYFDKNLNGSLKSKHFLRTQSDNNLELSDKILNPVNKTPELSSQKSTISISSDEEQTILLSPKISQNEFCYNKIYDDDIDIMSFIGQVNRNEIQMNKPHDTLSNSPNNTIVNKSLTNSANKSFRRCFSESFIGDKELNYNSPTKLDNSFTQLHENIYTKFKLTENYADLSQSFDDIEISDEELNYSVLKSNKNKNKDISLSFKKQELLSQSSNDSNSNINDEELYFSNNLHETETSMLVDKPEHDLDNSVKHQTNIFDFNDLPMDTCHSPSNDFNSPINPNQSESLKHPRLRDLSTPIILKSKIMASPPNPLMDDALNGHETSQKVQTPENHKTIQQIMTPNSNIIIKTTNITPLPNFNDMNTPERNKELAKYGLKPLKRSKGVKILQHIYDATHPITNISEKTHQSSSDDEDHRVIKRRKKLSDHFTSQPSCSKANNIIKRKSSQTTIQIDEKIKIVEQIAESESLNDLIFERKQSTKISSCRLPLHIAWHNLVSSQQDLQEKILLYEPVQIEEIYTKFKGFGYKYHIQDIIQFLDKKCITIRIAQNNRNRK